MLSNEANQATYPINRLPHHAGLKSHLNNVMVTSYDKGLDIFCEKLTHYTNWKNYPCIQPLDHKKYDNLQHTLSFSYHEKDAQTVILLYTIKLILKRTMQGMLMTTFKWDIFNFVQNFWISNFILLMHFKRNIILFFNRIKQKYFFLTKNLWIWKTKWHQFENLAPFLCDSIPHRKLLVFLYVRTYFNVSHSCHYPFPKRALYVHVNIHEKFEFDRHANVFLQPLFQNPIPPFFQF